jgi:hypothetical protein|tara:strand:- start:434 stop:934 length:501 start_codon:yes stop_codon:yes gene_type:complete
MQEQKMTGDKLLSIDKLDEFMANLDNYMSDVVQVEPSTEVEKILNLTGFELKSLTSEECCEKAYVLYSYCGFLQKRHNAEAARLKWCEGFINHTVAGRSDNFDKFTKWEVKVNHVIKEDDFVQKVWRVKRVVEGKVTMSSDTIRDLRKQADTLIELGRKKHYRSQS